MKNSNQPAYPTIHQNSDGTIQYNVNQGMTKREYFAAMAMQGILAGIPQRKQDMLPLLEYYSSQYPDKTMNECVSMEAVALADELLKQLEVNTPDEVND